MWEMDTCYMGLEIGVLKDVVFSFFFFFLGLLTLGEISLPFVKSLSHYVEDSM